jgi:long-chain fatty acid transport protein
VNILKNSSVAIMIILLGTLTVHAGGYQVNEHGARATGMGGAVFSNIMDASAIYFNAGALGFIPGTDIVLGSTLIFPSSKFTGPATQNTETEMESNMYYPSVLYASHTLENGLSLGLGVFNPYGLGTEWNESWGGRYLGTESTLRTFFINPTVAYRINDMIGVGIGFNYVLATVKLKQAQELRLLVPPFTELPDGRASLEGDGTGVGWNIGLYLKPHQDINIGLAYRSKVTIDVDGEAEIDVSQAAQLFPLWSQLLVGGNATTEFVTPANLHVGLSYFGLENLSLNLGFQYIFWEDVERILIDFEDKTYLPDGTAIQDQQVLPFNYENGYIFRFGLEYALNEKLDLRAGYLFDSNPSQDEYLTPRLPDSDRHGITLGFGYKLSDLVTVDVGYMFLSFVEREITDSEINYMPLTSLLTQIPTRMNGTYSSTANLFALNFKFGF